MDYQGIKVSEPVSFFRGIAREALRGRWGMAIGAGFLCAILMNFPVAIFNNLFGPAMGGAGFGGVSGSYMDVTDMETVLGGSMSEYTPSVVSGIYALLTTGALSLGMAILVIHIVRRADAGPAMVFSGFGNYFKSLGMMLLMWLMYFGVIIAAVFLMTFLLIAAGGGATLTVLGMFVILLAMVVVLLIIYLNFGLSYYILADNPGMGVASCMGICRRMMKGNKGKLLLLYLSFIGWWLLYGLYFGLVSAVVYIAMPGLGGAALVPQLIVTLLDALGIGILMMYVNTSEAAFYERVSGISSGMFNLSGELPNENRGYIPEQDVNQGQTPNQNTHNGSNGVNDRQQ